MKPVKIYIKTTCPFCHKVMEFFDGKGVSYESIDLTSKPEELAKLKADTGLKTVPQVFIGEQLIGGCDDTLALDAKGELDKLLNA